MAGTEAIAILLSKLEFPHAPDHPKLHSAKPPTTTSRYVFFIDSTYLILLEEYFSSNPID